MSTQLFQDLKGGQTFLLQVPVASCGAREVLIQSEYSLISSGTERMLVEFGRAGLISKARQQPEKVKMVLDKIRTDGLLTTLEMVQNKISDPIPLGYCNAGTVLAVGREVTDLRVGDRVVSNGPHAEVVAVPRNLVAKVPDGVPMDQAAFTVLASIALNGQRILAPGIGENVAVVGLGLIGLITLDLLRAAGVRAVGIDLAEAKVKLARSRGYDAFQISSERDTTAEILSFTEGLGYDGVIITAATKSNAPIELSAKLCRKKGRIVATGAVGLSIPRAEFYQKELAFFIATSYGPGRYDPKYESGEVDYPIGYVRWTENRNFQAILDLLASGKLDFGYLVEEKFPFERAAEAYERVITQPQGLGLVLKYGNGAAHHSRKVLLKNSASAKSGRPKIGVVGAGNFTRLVMLPALKGEKADLVGICSEKGATSSLSARRFGFDFATTDVTQIVEGQDIDTVFILTPHHTHADLAARALRAGKNVFVEKPLANDLAQLAVVVRAYREAEHAGRTPRLMVGFNRRFSPHGAHLRRQFGELGPQLMMDYLVNAGAIPPEHWVHDPRTGGGRMIGEGCHFVDLMAFVAGSPVEKVYSQSPQRTADPVKNDQVSCQLRFANGAVGTLCYSSGGAKSYPKEVMRVVGGGRVADLLNFRKVTGFGVSSTSTFKLDKGHKAEVAAFLRCIRDGEPSPIPFASLVNTTLATFAHVRSLQEERPVLVAELENELEKLVR